MKVYLVGGGNYTPNGSTALTKCVESWMKMYQIAGKQAVFHGFGCTSWKLLSAFPWYSVDSASWRASVRYGRVSFFDREKRNFVTFGLGDRKQCYQQASLLRQYGYSPEEFADRSKNDSHRIRALSLASYKMAEQYLTERWGEVEIPA